MRGLEDESCKGLEQQRELTEGDALRRRHHRALEAEVVEEEERGEEAGSRRAGGRGGGSRTLPSTEMSHSPSSRM